MTPFRFEREFVGDAEAYWHAFFDEDCSREQYEAVGVRSFEVVELSRDDRGVRRSVRVVPARDLPAMIRRVTGASLGYLETTVYRRAEGTAETVVVPSTLASRIEVVGTHRITASGGSISRVFEGTVAVRLPLVGRRIERIVLDDMAASYRLGAAITQAWMDRLAEGR